HLLAKHRLRERRAADVTQTHEQYGRLASTHSQPFPWSWELSSGLGYPGTPLSSRGVRSRLTQSRGVPSHAETRRSRSESRGRAAFVVRPSVPRPEQRSCWMWFLPVGSQLIPPENGPERGKLHPADVDSPGANNHITKSPRTPRRLRSARNAEAPTLRALRGSCVTRRARSSHRDAEHRAHAEPRRARRKR